MNERFHQWATWLTKRHALEHMPARKHTRVQCGTHPGKPSNIRMVVLQLIGLFCRVKRAALAQRVPMRSANATFLLFPTLCVVGPGGGNEKDLQETVGRLFEPLFRPPPPKFRAAVCELS